MIEKSKVDESKILGIGVGVLEPIDFASGNGLRKNAAFVHEVSEQFGLSVLFSDFLEKAAVGAAICGSCGDGLVPDPYFELNSKLVEWPHHPPARERPKAGTYPYVLPFK